MASPSLSRSSPSATPPRRRLELLVFAVLAILVWPVIAVGVVGGWGLAVWMYQQFNGPPGPPSHS
ncbi:MAG TPA: periplasmic nitrate reductase, NapE protein [Acetobacteraceae bacterium]